MNVPVYEVTRDELKDAVEYALSKWYSFVPESMPSSVIEGRTQLQDWINNTDRVLFGASIARDGYIGQCPVAGYRQKTGEFTFQAWQSSFAYHYDIKMNQLVQDRLPIRSDELSLLHEENEETEPGIAEIV